MVTGGAVRGSGSIEKLTVGSSGMAVVGTDGPTFVNGNVRIDGMLQAELPVHGAPLLSVSRRVRLGSESALQLHTSQPLGRQGEVFVQIVESS